MIPYVVKACISGKLAPSPLTFLEHFCHHVKELDVKTNKDRIKTTEKKTVWGPAMQVIPDPNPCTG